MEVWHQSLRLSRGILIVITFVVRAAFYYEVYLLLLRLFEGSFLLRGILIVITLVSIMFLDFKTSVDKCLTYWKY